MRHIFPPYNRVKWLNFCRQIDLSSRPCEHHETVRLALASGCLLLLYMGVFGRPITKRACDLDPIPRYTCNAFVGSCILSLDVASSYLVLNGISRLPLVRRFCRSHDKAASIVTFGTELVSWTVVLTDLHLFTKTGLHLRDFWMPIDQLWQSCVGFRAELLVAVILHIVTSLAILVGIRLCIPCTSKYVCCAPSPLGRILILCATLLQTLLFYAIWICLITPASVFGFAVDVSPLRVLRPQTKICVTGPRDWGKHSGTRMYAHEANKMVQNVTAFVGDLDAPADASTLAVLNGTHDLLEHVKTHIPYALARTPQNMILVVIDSVPAREFISGIPEKRRRTSDVFRAHVKDVMGHFNCKLLEHHYTGSSYTHDAMYTLLHSVPPVLYTDEAFPWSIPVQTMRQAGIETAMFQHGDIGYDYCTDRTLKDGGGTSQFEVNEILSSDKDVTKEALAWVASRKMGKPYFLVLYYESTHMLYGLRKFAEFERSMETILDDVRLLTDAIKASESGNDKTLLMITADHGSAVSGVDDDCSEYCEGHGYQTFGNHATDQVAHVPFWICPLTAGNSHKPPPDVLLQAAQLQPITSSADLMPTLLDVIGIHPRGPTRFWSTGRSWLLPGGMVAEETSAPLVFSLSRLKCRQDVAMITTDVVRYHTSEVGCIPWRNASECETSYRIVNYPQFNSWTAGSIGEPPDERGNPSAISSTVIDHRLSVPILNRAALPYPPCPLAALLVTKAASAPNDQGMVCVELTSDNTTALRDCPKAFHMGDVHLLSYLWRVSPDGRLLHAIKPVEILGRWRRTNDTVEGDGPSQLKRFSVCMDAHGCQDFVLHRPWLAESTKQSV